MRTIQITFDDELITIVDSIVKAQHTTRAAFTRNALKMAVEQYRLQDFEQRQIIGYQKKPVQPDEFSTWESEQAWGEE